MEIDFSQFGVTTAPAQAFPAIIPASSIPMTTIRADPPDNGGWERVTSDASLDGGFGNYFEALRNSHDRKGIPYAMVNLAPQILRLLNGLNRKMLSAVGRYLVDNHPLAKLAVAQIAHYSTPVNIHSACADQAAADKYDAYWENWKKAADMTRRYTYEDLQTIACKAIDTDGDIGAVITTKYGFPQVRFFDTYHVGNLSGMDPQDGVVVDDLGVLQGYKVCDGPIDTLVSSAQTFIPSSQMTLLKDAERYNYYRGFSAMRPGSNSARDLWDIMDFTKTKEKVGAALAAVIQQKGPLDEDEWGDRTARGDDLGDAWRQSGQQGPSQAGQKVKHDPRNPKITLAQLFGGDIPVIEGELKQFMTQASGAQVMEFVDYLAGLFVAGLEIPPAWFLDTKLTGPNVRSVLGKVQRKVTGRSKEIARFDEFNFIRVIAWGIRFDGLPETPDWMKVSYQLPPLVTIDLGDQMQNERADVLCGQMTEKRRFGNQGLDWKREQAQLATELDVKLSKATELQKKYPNVPLEVILARLGFGTLALSEGASKAQEQKPNQKPGDEKDEKKETSNK
ncbi:MAG TPA: phage portal protein [Verrucomicrobiae bacterium]|jgi:hypothetical protein